MRRAQISLIGVPFPIRAPGLRRKLAGIASRSAGSCGALERWPGGRFARIAKAAKRGRETLYSNLSSGGNPTLEKLLRLFDAAGLKLSVEPKKRAGKAA